MKSKLLLLIGDIQYRLRRIEDGSGWILDGEKMQYRVLSSGGKARCECLSFLADHSSPPDLQTYRGHEGGWHHRMMLFHGWFD